MSQLFTGPLGPEPAQRFGSDEGGGMLDLPLTGPGAPGPSELPPIPRRSSSPPPRRRPRLWLWISLAATLAATGLYLLISSAPVVEPSAVRLDYSPVRPGGDPEGRELTFANRGKRQLRVKRVTLQGPAAGDYDLSGDGCTGARLETGEECAVGVVFTPVSEGAKEASLVIDGNASNCPLEVPLSGRAIEPRIAVRPGALDFGGVEVGRASSSAGVAVENRGTAPLQIGRALLEGSSAGDFGRRADSCSGKVLPPGESCDLRLVLTPSVAGPRAARLRIESDSAEPMEPVALTGEGLLSGPPLAFSESEIDFGRQPLNATSDLRKLTLVNRGVDRLRLRAVELEQAAAGPFAVQADACSSVVLEGGGSCALQLVFRPDSLGGGAGRLRIVAAGGGEGAVAELRGEGAAPRLAWDPDALDFGEVATSGSGERQALEMVNEGTWPLDFQRLEVAGADRELFALADDRCSGSRLGPGERCRVGIVFRPRGDAGAAAELALPWKADGLAQRPTVSLLGRGLAARLEVSPSVVDFGAVPFSLFRSAAVTVTNGGSAPMVVTGVQLREESDGEFQLLGDECSAATAVGPGERCRLSLRYGPRGGQGRSAAELVVEAGSAGRETVRLVGAALPPPQPELRVSPEALRFGAVAVGGRSDIATLTLGNPGSGRLALQELRIGGGDERDFRLVPGSCQGAGFLVPDSECTVGVRFTPTAPGTRRSWLRIGHNAPGGELRVEVSGEGMQP